MTNRDWPTVTIAIAGLLAVAFGLQYVLAPTSCRGTDHTAFCAAAGLLRTDATLAVFLMPVLHGTLAQFGTNLGLFLAFGTAVERWAGRRSLLWLFVLGGFLSTALQLQAKLAGGQPPITVGSSGGVAALAAFVAVDQLPTNRQSIDEYVRAFGSPWTVGRPLLWAVGVYLTVRAPLAYLALVPVDPKTATLSHVVGVGFGGATALVLRFG